MKQDVITCLTAVLLFTLPWQQITADDFVVWTGDPIMLHLQVGVTRRVQLLQAAQIRVGLPPNLYARDDLQIEVLGNTAWITVHEAISPVRFVIESRPTGEHLIFEVRTTQHEVDAVLKVEDAPKADVAVNPSEHGFVALTRWAVRSVYAPKRLQTPVSGLSRYPVLFPEMDLFRCGPNPPALCGGAVQAHVKSIWRTVRHYLSIVEVTNRLDQPVTLDPREIRGSWRTATFVHSRLSPWHDPASATTLVLISDLPPEQAIAR